MTIVHVREVFRLADLQEARFRAAPTSIGSSQKMTVMLSREAAHQMLRPLEHEIPPQVRKAEQRLDGAGSGAEGSASDLNRHPDAGQHFACNLLLLET